MKQPYLKKLGPKQKDLLVLICEKYLSGIECHILHVQDYSDHTQDISVSDDDGNDYVKVTLPMFASFISRGIISCNETMQNGLNVVISKYKLHDSLLKKAA